MAGHPQPVPESVNIMRTPQRLAIATLLAVAGASAFAGTVGEYAPLATKAESLRSREAVIAEVLNLRAQGELAIGGELSDAVAVAPAAALQAPVLTRADVKAQVTAARAAHALPRNGELM